MTTIERLDALDVFPERDHCIYPIGHPGSDGFRFCKARVPVVGSPYCREHLQKCHVASAPKLTQTPRAPVP